MKFLLLAVLLPLMAHANQEIVPIYGHIVLYRCDHNLADCASVAPDEVVKTKIVLAGDDGKMLQGQDVFQRRLDGYEFTVVLTGYKMSSGDYFFRADLKYRKIGSSEVHSRKLGNTFLSRVRSLGQVYFTGEKVDGAPLSVDFGFGFDPES
jgi:hypothetical protein